MEDMWQEVIALGEVFLINEKFHLDIMFFMKLHFLTINIKL